MRLAVLCASYNRAETTLKGLTQLWAALAAIPNLQPKLFLLDDASPDNTAERVRAALPDAIVMNGTGGLFWNRGMRAAYLAARNYGEWDAYLIFNDDTEIISQGVAALFDTFRRMNARKPTACVGILTSLDGTQRTYGGYQRASGRSPLSLLPVPQNTKDQPCDTFNGNFVLIPARNMNAADPFPAVYHHQYGDLDLGYALGRQGVDILECAQTIGRADRNIKPDTSTIGKRWKSIAAPPRGLGQYVAFVRRNVPFPNWPFVAIAGLTVIIAQILVGQRS